MTLGGKSGGWVGEKSKGSQKRVELIKIYCMHFEVLKERILPNSTEKHNIINRIESLINTKIP